MHVHGMDCGQRLDVASPRIPMAGIRTHQRNHEPRKHPAQARSRQTVAAIVEGAAQVFEELGYHETTTDLIAARAGVSIGTLYQYFPDKDVLLVALFERHLGETRELYERLGERLEARVPLHEVVRTCVAEMFALHRPCPRVHRIFIEDAPLPARVFAVYAELERPIHAKWKAYLRDVVPNPDLMATMIITTLETLTHRLTLYPPPGRTPAELEAGTVAMVVSYVEAATDRR